MTAYIHVVQTVGVGKLCIAYSLQTTTSCGRIKRSIRFVKRIEWIRIANRTAKTLGFAIVLRSDFVPEFLIYCAMHFSAKRGLVIACRLFVCPSVTLMDCDHIGWKSWQLAALTISPTCTFTLCSEKAIHILPAGEYGDILGRLEILVPIESAYSICY